MANNTEDVPVSDHVYDQSLRCVNCGIVSGHGEQRGNRNCPNLKRYTTQSSSHNTEDVELVGKIACLFMGFKPNPYWVGAVTSQNTEATQASISLFQQESSRQKAELLDRLKISVKELWNKYGEPPLIDGNEILDAIEVERKQLEEK